MLDHLRRIIVEGPVGSGKTARSRGGWHRPLRSGELLDGVRDNPSSNVSCATARHALPLQLACPDAARARAQRWQERCWQASAW